MKKFLIGSLTVLTVMWAVGLAAVVAVPAQAAVGDLVKSASSNTVYVVKSDGVTICQFPHANVYSSWGYPADFSTVMTKDLSSYTVGTNVEFRDASLVKGDGPAVYMVYNGMKRPIVSDVVFLALGYDWDKITWLSDAFLADYTTGSDVSDSSTHPDGQLVKYAGSPAVYLIDGGVKRAFQSASAFEDNRYSWDDVITIPDSEVYADGAPITAYEAALSLPACIGTGSTPSGSGLTVALSPATPAATSIIADSTNGGQALVPFTTVNFTASSDGDVKVTNMKFKRTGISSDTSLDNLYLYDGNTKLTDGGSLSSGIVTFNNANGLFTVPAGTTKSVTVKGDVNKSTASGQTIGFELVSASDVTTDGAAVSGSFPASGNLMTVATVNDLGKMYITTSSVATSVDPNTQDVEVWKATFYSSNQKMELDYLKFTSLGSIQSDDLSNFRLYDGGTLVATASMNSDREVVFDLSGSPVNFTVGQSKLLKVLADVDKGSTRTYNFTLQEATDVVAMDQNYNVYVAPYPGYLSVGNWAVIKMATDTTIGSGSLSVVKSSSAPTGNVSLDGTNILFGKWDLTATGEDMKVKNFDIKADTSVASAGLDNGKVYYNGVQVGSTYNLTEDTDVNFTFGSSLVVPAGETGTLEVYADAKKADSTSFSDGDTVTVYVGAGSSNVQQMSSLGYVSAPSSDVAANQLTITAGSLTISEYSGYSDQTMVAGVTGAKVASAVFQAGSAEGVNVTSITVTLSSNEAASTTNLMLMKDGVQLGTTKVTPSASNIFSVNFDVPASGSVVVDVYADFKSGSDNGPWTAAVYADGNGSVTSNAVTGGSTSDNMQTISLDTGSLTFAADSTAPDSDIVVAGASKVLLNAVKFSALYEAFEVQEVTVTTTAGMLTDFSKVYLEYPTETGTGSAEGYLVNNTVTFTGLNMYVPKDGDAVLNIYSDINTITNGAKSGDEGDLTLAVNDSQTFKAVGLSSGTVDTDPDDSSGLVQGQNDVAGNDMVVRKTRPTVSLATLPTTTLSNGTRTISKFTVTADAAEDVSLYELTWDISTSGPATFQVSSPALYDNANPGTALTASGTPTVTNSVITFQLASEEVISAGTSKTYFLNATVANSDGDGDSILTRLASPYTTTVTGTAYDAAVNGKFVWSDNSASSHSYTSSDWANAEFVKTLPTDYQTLSN